MSRTGKKAALLLGLIMLLAAVPSLAATDRSIAEYENLVSTYSIDAGIPSYDDYRKARDEVRPDCRIVLEGADVVRYEEEGAEAPTLLSDYAGMPGISLLTGEEALAEWEFTVEEEGWYDPCLEYYPYEGKNSEILFQRRERDQHHPLAERQPGQ